MKKQKRKKRQSPYPARRFELFLESKSPVQVAIDLDLETDRVMSILNDFLRLQNLHKAVTILKATKNSWPLL